MPKSLMVPTESQHTVGLMAPQVCLYKRIGHQLGIVWGHSRTSVDRGSEVRKACRVDAIAKAHHLFLFLRPYWPRLVPPGSAAVVHHPGARRSCRAILCAQPPH